MTIQTSKIIEVLNAETGATRTTVVHQDTDATSGQFSEQAPYPRDLYGNMTIDPERASKQLTEAATGMVSTSNFPDILRMGVQFDALTGFNEYPTVYERLVRSVSSSKPFEEYQDDEGIGQLPIVSEGEPFPEVAVTIGAGKKITNYKRGMILPVTWEAQKFDQIGFVRSRAEMLGRAARFTREQAVMNVITTTNNYNVLNNNDGGGNNTQTLAFTPTNLNEAMRIMTTQKDKKSGQYLGVMPRILLIGPLLEKFVRELLNSPTIMRAPNTGATSEVYGQGTTNPFFGAVSQIVVSPLFGASYQWALIDPSRFIYFQTVAGITVETEAANTSSESWFTRQLIRTRVWDFFGVGVRDDRFGFYSDSTSAPAGS
jgi:hypothetical protein